MKKLLLTILILLTISNYTYAFLDKGIIFKGTVVRTEFSFDCRNGIDGTLILIKDNIKGCLIAGHWNIQNGDEIIIYRNFFEGTRILLNGKLLEELK